METVQQNTYPSMSSTNLDYQVNQIDQAMEVLLQQINIFRQQMFEVDRLDLNSQQCSICMEFKNRNKFFSFCCQTHTFCSSCIYSLQQQAINNSKIIYCPIQECGVQFNQDSPYFGMLTPTNKQKYKKILRNRDILSNPNIRMCSKVDCQGQIQINSSKIQCNLCQRQYCKKCLQFIHDGKCDHLIARSMQKRYKYRKCSRCKMIVQKQEGCDHMTCICKHQFCYKCGQSYKYGGHVCQKPKNLKGIAAFRWYIQREPTQIERLRFINLTWLLQCLQTNPDHSFIFRSIYTLVFTLTIYPLLVTLVISIISISIALYLCFAGIAIVLYFLILPLAQFFNLQLAPAQFLQRKKIPKNLIRLLMLPLYPINFFFGIKDKSDFLTCKNEIIKGYSLLRLICFFIVLPILINVQIQ